MRIHHVALRTRDLPRLEVFYAGILGLAVLRRDGTRSVWLQAGDAILMLERAEDDEPAVPAGSKDLVAFTLEPGAPADAGRLARAGIPVEARTVYTLYVRDPDGRRVGLSSYPDALDPTP